VIGSASLHLPELPAQPQDGGVEVGRVGRGRPRRAPYTASKPVALAVPVKGRLAMPHLGPRAFDAAVLAFLRQQPATRAEVLAHLYRNYGGRCTNRGTFQMRMARQVRGRVTAKLLVKGKNLYIPAEAVADVAGRFDLSDPVARLVAADGLEERDQGELAGLLRKAKRFTCGP
jgi:hypothetical protein